MTPKEYEQWRRLHGDLFNLHSPDDLRLFTLWERCLGAFEFEELRDASFAVVTDPSDKRRFRENHLAMLREAVLAERAEAATRERDRLDRQYNRAECDDCFAVGLIRVPHPDWLVNDELERSVFMVVTCPCPAGVAKFNAVAARLIDTEARHKIIDLAEYEALHPDWRNILAARQEAQARELDAADLARQVDRISPIDQADIRKIADRGKS